MTDSPASPLTIHAHSCNRDTAEAGGCTVDADRQRFVSRLFERHRDALLRYLTGLLSGRADAEDIIQETCARLLKAPHLDRTEAMARAYMFKIATHLAYDHYRALPVESFDSGGHEALLSSAGHQPELIVGFEQGFEIVKKTLLELRPRCRRVFLLRASEGLDYTAIAEKLGVSKRTVEREMKHALDVLQRRLKRSS